MPIDKVASTRGNPVFGLSPEQFKDFYGVRSRPWIADGASLPPLPRNPNLAYHRNPLLDAILNQRTQQYDNGVTGLMTPLYRPGGLLYKPPARRDA